MMSIVRSNPDFTVTAFAPATVANVVCGFDVFGLAANEPGDIVSVRWSTEDTGSLVRIVSIEGDNGSLSRDAERNTAGVAILQLMQKHRLDRPVDLALVKGLPLGSGMGSSAASAVAALVAFNELASLGLSRIELLPFAMEAERSACGSAHADNVAPCLMGGFVLVRSYEPLDVVSIPFSASLHVALVHPDIELKTRDARSLLRQSVSLRDAISQWGNTAGMVAGLMKGDMELVSRSMEDRVAEPVRGLLIPGYDLVRQAARTAGAIGCGISGSGPTLFALCNVCQGDEALPLRVGKAMQEAFTRAGLTSSIYVSPLNTRGARLL